jgi:hypothetical protein
MSACRSPIDGGPGGESNARALQRDPARASHYAVTLAAACGSFGHGLQGLSATLGSRPLWATSEEAAQSGLLDGRHGILFLGSAAASGPQPRDPSPYGQTTSGGRLKSTL